MREIIQRIIRLAIICAIFAVIYFMYHIEKEVKTDDLCGFQHEFGLKLFPEMGNYRKITDKCCYEISDKSGNILGKILYVKPDETIPSGYGGQFRVVVGVTQDNKVIGIDLGENHETPGFIEMAKGTGYFNTWNGLELHEAINKKVDTITGATKSTNGIKCMVQKNLSDYLGEEIKIDQSNQLSYILIGSIILLIFSILFFFVPKITLKFRTLHLVLLVGLFGFLGGYSLSVETFRNSLITGTASYFSLALFFLAVLFPLFTGKNFYCTQVCPFGACQELMGKIPAKKISMPARIIKFFTLFKRSLIYAIVVLLVFKVLDDFTVFEPFSAFQYKGAGTVSIVIALTALTVSIFISKPWCRFFCPTGSIFNFLVGKPKPKHK